MTRPAATKVFEFELSVPVSPACRAGHFPGRPLVPGALLCSALAEALEHHCNGVLVGLRKLRFKAPLAPGQGLRVRCERRSDGAWRLRVDASGVEVLKGVFDLEVIEDD